MSVLGLLAAALLLSEVGRAFTARKASSLETEVDATRAEAKAALSAVIPPATIENADRSVYLVRQQINSGDFLATAFVIDRDKGVLATAAHVAIELDIDNPDRPATIVNRYTGTPLRIIGRKVHAGFYAYAKMVDEYAPIRPDSPIGDPQAATMVGLPFDVALLFVDPHDPDTGENILGPALPIAPEDKLHGLKAGDVIAMIGYPVDSLNVADYAKGFSSRSERGVVAAMISPIDTASTPHNSNAEYLIVHRMQLIGGNSGGPVFNGAGEVIGVNSYVSFRDSVAQRADMLYDMLEPLREEERLTQVYQPDLRALLGEFPRAEDVLPYAFYANYRRRSARRNDSDPKLIADIDPAINQPFRTSLKKYKFDSPSYRYVLLAPDLEDEKTSQTLKTGGGNDEDQLSNGIAEGDRKAFVINRFGQYSAHTWALSGSENHIVFALDFATSINFTTQRVFAQCPVQFYVRRHGKSVLSELDRAPIPSFMIPANGEGFNRFDIIVSRSGCSDFDNRYLFGIVSWADPQAPQTQSAAFSGAGPSLLVANSGLVSNLRNAFDCWSPDLARHAACVLQIHAANLRRSP